MGRSANWALDLLGVIAKGTVMLTTADILAYLFQSHYDTAYAAGLLIGVVLQHAIFPRARWRKEALFLIPAVLIVGIIHAVFRR